LLSHEGGLVVVTAPDDTSIDHGVAEHLASLPCIVIAIDRSPEDTPSFADVVPEAGVASLDDILGIIDRNPVAASALALLLRGSQLPLGQGLMVESAVYSMLQSGAEFKKWRSERPTRNGDTSTTAPVRVERDGTRLDIVLSRPDVRNALNVGMRDGLLDGLAVARADRTITQVILRGDGPSFSSGGDLNEFGSFADPASAHLVRLTTSIGRAMERLGTRLAVHVHGPCAGSGVELPSFATQVVAQSDFTASLPEVQLGLVPGAGGTVSITRRIGRHRMALLALGGARIDATTALRWGLVDRVSESWPADLSR
jgi:enoyl-CoA hydratase/carnithine racemase